MHTPGFRPPSDSTAAGTGKTEPPQKETYAHNSSRMDRLGSSLPFHLPPTFRSPPPSLTPLLLFLLCSVREKLLGRCAPHKDQSGLADPQLPPHHGNTWPQSHTHSPHPPHRAGRSREFLSLPRLSGVWLLFPSRLEHAESTPAAGTVLGVGGAVPE